MSLSRMAQVDASIPDTFQKYIDIMRRDPACRALLIFSGSAVGLLQGLFINGKAPLFGRMDQVINLTSFNFAALQEVLRDLDFTDPHHQVCLYTMLDGIPHYFRMLAEVAGQPPAAVLDRLFLDPLAPLFEEGKNILIEEFGGAYQSYFAILEAVAGGYNSGGAISSYTTLKDKTVSKYIHDLVNRYHILERRRPVYSQPNARRSRYTFKDLFYRFWFAAVYTNAGAIRIAPDMIKPVIMRLLETMSGLTFERICRQHLELKLIPGLDFIPHETGQWWDRHDEIDIVSIDRLSKRFIACECKWRDELFTHAHLETFTNRVHRLEQVIGYSPLCCFVFTKIPPSADVIEAVAAAGVEFIDIFTD